MDNRLNELLALAEAGDEDIALQVASEIALMPETRQQRLDREMAYAEQMAESIAPPPEKVSQEELDKLAQEADF